MTPDNQPRGQGDPLRPADEPVMIGAGLHDVEARLRRSLGDDAASIAPRDRLGSILDTAHSGAPLVFLDEPQPRRPWLAIVAAASVAAVAAGSLWVAGRPSPSVPVATQPSSSLTVTTSEPSPSGSTSSAPPSTSPGATATTTTSGSTGTTVAPVPQLSGIPVYWIGETGRGPKLFREYLSVPDTGGGKIQAAVAAMTRMNPLDPDYLTPWRPASRVSVTQSGSALVVNLSADALAGTNVGSALAAMGVQQLVWTATAAASVAGTPATTVTIRIDGKAADAWGAVRLGQPMSRGPQLDVQAQAWITSLVHGQQVAKGPVTVKGLGTSFEGTFGWKITRPDGTVVDSGSAQGGSNGTFGELSFTTTTLVPGTYVVTLATDDPSGGAEGNGPDVDTKTVTVR